MPKIRNAIARVRCPYCFEQVDLFIDPETTGAFVEDCSVCCRPWAVTVFSDDTQGELGRRVEVTMAQ